MSENTIYSLACSLQQTERLEQEFNRMLSALQSTIETEYLQKIHTAAKSEKLQTIEHPPKEVTLLRALSAFTDDTGKNRIDQMTQSLLFLHTLQHINENVNRFSAGNLLEARSADGSLPSPHSARLAGLLLALSLAEQF